ncbi:MAG: type II toxin-antitoxin system HicA family toxin [Oscillospiraceae bacterium]|nr:type II toxin-antitoxin system HicA family toxin [Oscillospiraceae bacterium]
MGLTVKPREMIKFLEENGYKFVRAKGGSHHIYGNGTHSLPIPIHGSKDFGEEFIRIILKETGISKSDLLKYLKR